MDTKTFLEQYGSILFRGYWCGGGKDKNGTLNHKIRKGKSTPESFKIAMSKYPFLLGALHEHVVMVDYDDPAVFQCRLKIAREKKECCVAIESQKRGGHMYWFDREHTVKSSVIHRKTLLTFNPVDYKCGYKIIKNSGEIRQADNYACLSKEDKTLRNVVYSNIREDGTLEEIPFYDLPISGADNFSFFNMSEGDGRNDRYFQYMIPVKNAGYTYEQFKEVAEIIDQYIVSEPLPDDEWKVATRREAWDGIKQDSPKKEVNPETFNKFLKEERISVRYNELLNIVEFENIPNKADYQGIKDVQNQMPTVLQYGFRKYTGLKNISKQQTIDLISLEADKNSYNPVKNFLQGTAWDGIDRFPELFQALGVQTDFEKSLIRKWFYQSAALPYNSLENPIQPEGVLILQGAEGIGKTRFFRRMAFDPLWFKSLDKPMSTKNKDTLIETLSAWITEIGEIDRTFTERRSDLKSFMTLEKDTIRRPYAREQLTSARTTSICGTTNKPEFLNDETGSRRWWVIHIQGEITLDGFATRENLKQFWAQCHQANVIDPKCFRLSDDEKKQLTERNQSVMELLPAEDELRLRFDFEAPESEWEWVQPAALRNIPTYDVAQYSAIVIGKALTKISEDFPAIRRKKHEGLYKWFIPPAKEETDRFRNNG